MAKEQLTFIIISAYGIQQELAASARIHGIAKSLSSIGVEVHLVTPLLTAKAKNDFSFARVTLIEPSIMQRIVRTLIEWVLNLRFSKKNLERKPKVVYQSTTKTTSRIKSWAIATINFWTLNKYIMPVRRLVKAAFQIIISLPPSNRIVVFTSSAPGSMHLVGGMLKRHFGKRIFWIKRERECKRISNLSLDCHFIQPP